MEVWVGKSIYNWIGSSNSLGIEQLAKWEITCLIGGSSAREPLRTGRMMRLVGPTLGEMSIATVPTQWIHPTLLSGKRLHSYWKIAIGSGFSHEKRWIFPQTCEITRGQCGRLYDPSCQKPLHLLLFVECLVPPSLETYMVKLDRYTAPKKCSV
jgi:hypothetical protein